MASISSGMDLPPGPYTATYNGQSVGAMEGPIRHQQDFSAIPIRTGLWGQTIIDYIIAGFGVFAVLVLKEWDTDSKLAMWPFNASHGLGVEGGKLLATFAKSLVLTALPGTPAATEGPVTRTYPLAILLPGHRLDITMGIAERNTTVVMCALPEQDGSNVGVPKFFTDT